MDGDNQDNSGQSFTSAQITDESLNYANNAVVSGADTASLPGLDTDTTSLQKLILSIPQEASDTDLIEKEWVNLIEEVIAHTAEDPFSQQQEISRIKADYLQKRYNKRVSGGS